MKLNKRKLENMVKDAGIYLAIVVGLLLSVVTIPLSLCLMIGAEAYFHAFGDAP